MSSSTASIITNAGKTKKTKLKQSKTEKAKKITKPRRAWNYFTADYMKNQNGATSVDDKSMSEKWNSMSPVDKDEFIQLEKADRLRYDNDIKNMSDGDRKLCRADTRLKKAKKKGAPKRPLSAYMYFVKDKRSAVVEGNPGISFAEVGRKLGELWRSIDVTNKQTYVEMYNDDKARYKHEIKEYDAKMKLEADAA